MNTITALLKLTGDASGAMAALQKVEGGLGGIQKVAQGLTSVGKALTTYVTLPLLAAGAVAAKWAIDFDSAMMGVNSVLKLSGDEFQALKADVLDFSTTTSKSSADVALALRGIVSSGFAAGDAMDILRVAVDAAGNMMVDTGTTTRALTGILSVFGMEASAVTHIADVLEFATNNSKLRFGELATTIGTATGTAKALGITFEETVGSMMTMSKTEDNLAIATTQLNGVFTALLKPNEALTGLLNDLGFATGTAAIESLGLQGMMMALQEATGGEAAALAELFPNVRGMRGAFGLLHEEGATLANALDILGTASDGVGEHAAMAAIRHESWAYHITKLKSEVEVLAIRLVGTFMPAVIDVVDTLKDWFTNLATLPEPILKIIAVIAILAAAAGPALIILGAIVSALGTAFSVLLGPVGLVAVAIAGLALAWARDWGGIRTKVEDAWAVIRPVLEEQIPRVITIVNELLEGDWYNAWLNAALIVQDLFGTDAALKFLEWRDAILEFIAGIQSGKDPIDTFTGAMAGLIPQETLDKITDVRDRLLEFRDRLIEVGEKIAEFFAPTIERIKEKFLELGAELAPLGAKFTELRDAAAPAIEKIAAVFKMTGIVIGIVVGIIAKILGEVLAGILDNAALIVGGAVDVVTGMFQILGANIEGVVEIVKNIIEGDWAGAWEAAKQMFSDAWEGIKKILEGLLDVIEGIFAIIYDAIVNTVNDIFGTTLPTWEEAKEAIVSSWEFIKETAPKIWEAIKERITDKIEELRDKAKKLWENIKETITDKIKELKDKAEDLWNDIKKAVVDKIEELKDGVKSKWEDIKKAVVDKIEELKDGVKSKWEDIKKAVVDKIEELKSNAEKLWNDIKEKITDKIKELKDKAEDLWDDIKKGILKILRDLFKDMGLDFDEMVATWSEMWEDIKEIAAELWKRIVKIVEDKVKAITDKIEDLKEKAIDLWEDIKEKIVDKIEELKDRAIKLWNDTKEKVVDAVESLKDKVIDKWEDIKEKVIDAVETLKDKVTDKWHEIKGKIAGKIEDIKKDVEDKWEDIKSAVIDKVEDIKSAVQTKWTEIKTAIQTKMAEIKAIIEPKWIEIKTAIQTKLIEIKTDVQTKWTEIKTIVQTKLTEMKTAVQTKWDEIKIAIQTKLVEIKTVIQTKLEEAKSAIVAKAAGFVSAGKQLIQGLIDGVKAKAGALIAAATSAVQDAINAAKAALGMGSPSRVFAAMGIGAMEGLANGMADASGLALDQLSAIVGDLIEIIEGLGFDAEGASEWADAIQSLMDGLQAGLDVLAGIADYVSVADDLIQSFMDDFQAVMETLLTWISDEIDPTFDAEIVEPWGNIITDLMGGLAAGLELLTGLSEYVSVGDDAIQAFLSDFTTLVGSLADWIAGTLVDLIDAEVVEPWGGALESLLGGLAAGIETLAGLTGYISPTEAIITQFIADLTTLWYGAVAMLSDLSAYITVEGSETSAAFWAAMEQFLGAIGEAVGALAALQGYASASGAILPFIADLNTLWRAAIDMIADIVEYITLEGSEISEAFWAAMKQFVEAMGAAMEVLTPLRGYTAVSGTIITQFMADLNTLWQAAMAMIAPIIQYITLEGSQTSEAFWAAMKQFVEAMGAAMEVLTALTTYISPAQAAIDSFVADLLALVGQLVTAVVGFAATADAEVVEAWGNAIDSLMSGLADGLEVLTGLQDYASVGTQTISAFASDLLYMIDVLATYLAQLAGRIDAEVVEIWGDAIDSLMSGLGDGLEILAGLRDYVGIGTQAIQVFATDLLYMIDTLSTYLAQLAGRIDGEIVEVWGDAIDSLMGGLSDGLELLRGLVDFTAPADAQIDSFMTTLEAILVQFGDWAATSLANYATEAVTALGDTAESVFDGIGAAIDTLVKLSDYSGVPQAVMEVLMADMRVALTLVAALADQVAQETLDKATALTAAVEGIFDKLATAVDTLADLSQYIGVPSGIVGELVADMEEVVSSLADLAQTLSMTLIDSATLVAESTEAVFDHLSAAVDTLTGLSEYVGLPSGAAADFAADMAEVAASLLLVADLFSTAVLTSTMDFLAAVVEMLSYVQSALDLIAELAGGATSGMFTIVEATIAGMGLDAGAQFVQNIADGINATLPILEEVLASLIALFPTSIGAGYALGVGFVSSIIDGINATVGSLSTAAAGLAGLFSIGASGFNFGREFVYSIVEGIYAELPYLEAALDYLAGLFPSSPAERGPLAKPIDWGYLAQGLPGALDGINAMLAAPNLQLAAVQAMTPQFNTSSRMNQVNIGGTFHIREEADIRRLSEELYRRFVRATGESLL